MDRHQVWRLADGMKRVFEWSPAIALSLVVLLMILGFAIKLRHVKNRRTQLFSVSRTSIDSLKIEPLDFDWKTVEPAKFRPFKPIYHITMALRSSAPSELITIDMDYHDRVSLRRNLISQHSNTVHGCLPAGEAAVRELYQFLLQDYLPARFPTMFKLSTDGQRFENTVTGISHSTTPPSDAEAALRTLGETVEEDMFLLVEEPKGHRAVAFCCCFPSGFDPSAKLGKLLGEIHAPVPSYEKIGLSMERFFRKVEVRHNVKRVNWSMQTHPDLFNCEGNHVTDEEKASLQPDDDFDINKTFARLELQTLSRLPRTRALLFSFKTYLYPVAEVKAEGLGPQLADAIEGLKKGNAPGMWVYKGGVRWGERVCAYLRE